MYLIPLSNRLYPLEPDELSVILGEYFARKTPMNTDELFLRPFRPNAGENYSTANDVNNPKAQQEVYKLKLKRHDCKMFRYLYWRSIINTVDL